jgi:hypothetical protein
LTIANRSIISRGLRGNINPGRCAMIRRLLLASLGAFFRNRLWRACCRSMALGALHSAARRRCVPVRVRPRYQACMR